MATVKQILDMANSQLGIHEIPANSNKVKYNTEYYGKEVSGSAYPWCAVFVWWVFKHSNASKLFCGGDKVAYTPTVANYYKENKSWFTSNPKAGDLVLYKFSGSNRINHIGILKCVNKDGTISVYEGNTGTSSDANGGEVMLRVRPTTYVAGYGRPKYDNEDNETASTENTVKNLNTWVKRLQKAIGAEVDGIAGKETLSKCPLINIGSKGDVAKLLQEKLGVTADGEIGKISVKAIKTWQKKNKLTSDGIFGKNSWSKLLGL